MSSTEIFGFLLVVSIEPVVEAWDVSYVSPRGNDLRTESDSKLATRDVLYDGVSGCASSTVFSISVKWARWPSKERETNKGSKKSQHKWENKLFSQRTLPSSSRPEHATSFCPRSNIFKPCWLRVRGAMLTWSCERNRVSDRGRGSKTTWKESARKLKLWSLGQKTKVFKSLRRTFEQTTSRFGDEPPLTSHYYGFVAPTGSCSASFLFSFCVRVFAIRCFSLRLVQESIEHLRENLSGKKDQRRSATKTASTGIQKKRAAKKHKHKQTDNKSSYRD